MKNKFKYYGQRVSKVKCPDCDEEFESDTVEFLNIHSDELERDVMTFKCPNCKKERESLVYL